MSLGEQVLSNKRTKGALSMKVTISLWSNIVWKKYFHSLALFSFAFLFPASNLILFLLIYFTSFENTGDFFCLSCSRPIWLFRLQRYFFIAVEKWFFNKRKGNEARSGGVVVRATTSLGKSVLSHLWKIAFARSVLVMHKIRLSASQTVQIA